MLGEERSSRPRSRVFPKCKKLRDGTRGSRTRSMSRGNCSRRPTRGTNALPSVYVVRRPFCLWILRVSPGADEGDSNHLDESREKRRGGPIGPPIANYAGASGGVPPGVVASPLWSPAARIRLRRRAMLFAAKLPFPTTPMIASRYPEAAR